MKKFLAALSVVSVLSAAGAASAGGLAEPVDDTTVVPAGPSSSMSPWIIIPIALGVAALAATSGS